MKRHYPILAAGAGLMFAIAAGLIANSRPAEAARASFARPNYEYARAGAVLDLSRFGSLGDKARMSRLSTDVAACHDALAAAGVGFTQLPAMHATGGCGYDEAVLVKS